MDSVHVNLDLSVHQQDARTNVHIQSRGICEKFYQWQNWAIQQITQTIWFPHEVLNRFYPWLTVDFVATPHCKDSTTSFNFLEQAFPGMDVVAI